MKRKDIPNPNPEIITVAEDGDCVFYGVRKDPFRVYGLYRYRKEPEFRRMPNDVE